MNISKKEKIHFLISSALIISATLFYVIFDFGELDLGSIESASDGFSQLKAHMMAFQIYC